MVLACRGGESQGLPEPLRSSLQHKEVTAGVLWGPWLQLGALVAACYGQGR